MVGRRCHRGPVVEETGRRRPGCQHACMIMCVWAPWVCEVTMLPSVCTIFRIPFSIDASQLPIREASQDAHLPAADRYSGRRLRRDRDRAGGLPAVRGGRRRSEPVRGAQPKRDRPGQRIQGLSLSSRHHLDRRTATAAARYGCTALGCTVASCECSTMYPFPSAGLSTRR